MGKEIYMDGEYLRRNPTWHAEESQWKSKQIIKIISKNKIQPHSICEIGCGAGEVLNQMHLEMPEDISFSGYEISPQAFELCRKREKNRLHFYLGDIFDDEKAFFDIILAIDLVEHVEDYFGFLRRLREKAIYKIFHFPLNISVQTVLRPSQILRFRRGVGHIHYFTKETAIAALTDTGYEVIDYFYTAGGVELPAKTLGGLLAKLPRKAMFALNQDIAARFLGGFSLLALAK